MRKNSKNILPGSSVGSKNILTNANSSHTSIVHPCEVESICRRNFLKRGSYLSAYASMGSLLAPGYKNLNAQSENISVQKNLVWINMGGGWDILEVTDPKTRSTSGIDMIYSWDLAQTISGGSEKIGRWLPNIASLGDDLLVVRGLSMGTTSHMAGSVYMNTGILSNAGEVNAASIPAIVASESEATIPIIQLGGGSEVQIDRGLLNPVSVVRANNLQLYQEMYPTEALLKERNLSILDFLKTNLTEYEQKVGTNDRLTELISAEDKIRVQFNQDVGAKLQLSDADMVPFQSSVANLSNNANNFALALKLIKEDIVNCVNLGMGGFDTHANQTTRLQPILERFDFQLAAFVNGLKDAGKLDDTLIVVYSDFGRTPKVNGGNGRDHWPVGGALLIGGGIDGGRAVGGTDDDLLALGVNKSTGELDSGEEPLSPIHLCGSVLELTLGSSYLTYRPYLEAPAAMTRLKT